MLAASDRYAPWVWSALLALLILAPVFGAGYVLHLDMVFVPQQVLLPWNLGIGAGLPRSVPQDAVVALLAGPVSGEVLQKAVLFASLTLAGAGAARLAGGNVAKRLAAASLYLWSAYVASRLLMGHWGLLWAYGLLPWVVLAARPARSEGRWQPLAVLCGVGALVPTGGVLLAAAGVPIAVGPRSAMRASRRVLLVAVVALFNAPWWLPAIRSGVAAVSDPLGLTVFGTRADAAGPLLLSVITGGGVWNEMAHLTSRGNVVAVLILLLVLSLAVVGWPRWRNRFPAEALWLTVLGALGVVWAWATGLMPEQSWMQAVVGTLPGGGLLRDGQKWTAVWVLVVAVAAPHGLAWLARRAEHGIRILVALSLVLLPVLAMPDLAWGAMGRLRTAEYPSDWEQLRQRLADDPRSGDVVTLPWWTPFRDYRWNAGGPVLDPLPRYLTRTVVWNDSLPVNLRGEIVRVGGDDPRALVISQAIDAGDALGPVLAGQGIRWAVLALDQPQPGPAPDLTGTRTVWTAPGLELREVLTDVTTVRAADPVIVTVDLLAMLLLIGLSGRWMLSVARQQES